MKKLIEDDIVKFYNKKTEIMSIRFSIDDCIWYFNSDDVITITKGMELYDALDNFMQQNYIFGEDVLKNKKESNKLTWYSDCYYNPEDEWSLDSVSCLHIEKEDNSFKIWCTKKIYEKYNRENKSYGICFSPCSNGKYSKNINTGSTLQNDFITMIYQPLLEKDKDKDVSKLSLKKKKR